MWRFILAYGGGEKAKCFDKNRNLTVKINTQSNKKEMVGENSVLGTFPTVSLNNTEAFVTLVVWNTLSENQWHCISHHSSAFLGFYVQKKKKYYCSSAQ